MGVNITLEDDRPLADESRDGWSRFWFPYRDMSPEEFAARFAQALPDEPLSYDQFRYDDHRLGTWIDELCQILESPAELELCRKRFLGTTMVEFKLLNLGMCEREAVIIRELVMDGITVCAGQPILEVETSKTSWEYVAPLDGRLTMLVTAGSRISLGQPLVSIEPSKGAVFASHAATGPDWWQIATYLLPTEGFLSCGTGTERL